jgi:two-component system, chemotaxis family, response regulator Rcp1
MRKPIEGAAMPPTVLPVEDNPGDARLTQEVLRGTNNSLHLVVASDEVEALELLADLGNYAHASRPDLTLHDSNVPKMDGQALLVRIKEDAGLKAIHAAILSTSDSEADVSQRYDLQANCYLSKPLASGAFERLLIGINDFWLAKVVLPQQGESTWARNKSSFSPLLKRAADLSRYAFRSRQFRQHFGQVRAWALFHLSVCPGRE